MPSITLFLEEDASKRLPVAVNMKPQEIVSFVKMAIKCCEGCAYQQEFLSNIAINHFLSLLKEFAILRDAKQYSIMVVQNVKIGIVYYLMDHASMVKLKDVQFMTKAGNVQDV